MLAARWILRPRRPSLSASFFLLPSLSGSSSTCALSAKFSRSFFSFSSRVLCASRLVICDLAIPRRATPFRSVVQRARKREWRERERRRVIGHQCLLPTEYLDRRTRSTTRRRIMNSTVHPEECQTRLKAKRITPI